MATAKVDEELLERNIAYFKDILLQIQCHNYNWEHEKFPHVVANILIGDLRRILKCAIFLKENRILLLIKELDLPSRIELHEYLRKFVNIEYEYRHFHGNFTIAHVGNYPDLVSIAAHVIVDRFHQSILGEDVVYGFLQYEAHVFKYLPFMPKAHFTPHDRIQELAQAIEGLDVDVLQKIIGRAPVKHGLELVTKVDRVHYHDQREPEKNTSYLDPNDVLQASQVMVQ